ncbi:MAG TPA: hypothetical protein VFA18_21530, partial [Gemmataceae bacterium]|nr:hypothetical protein [Gemmataceae bacterium]
MTVTRAGWWWSIIAWAACLCGCAGPPPHERNAEVEHLGRVGKLCMEYRRTHHQQTPRTLDDLKQWAKGLKKDELTKLGVDNIDEALVSTRDHQPYVIVPLPMRGMGPVLAHEKVGDGTKVYALSPTGNVREMDP